MLFRSGNGWIGNGFSDEANSDVTLTKVISKVWEASSKLFPEILVGYQVLYKFVP